jgi:hypothetical protein
MAEHFQGDPLARQRCDISRAVRCEATFSLPKQYCCVQITIPNKLNAILEQV